MNTSGTLCLSRAVPDHLTIERPRHVNSSTLVLKCSRDRNVLLMYVEPILKNASDWEGEERGTVQEAAGPAVDGVIAGPDVHSNGIKPSRLLIGVVAINCSCTEEETAVASTHYSDERHKREGDTRHLEDVLNFCALREGAGAEAAPHAQRRNCQGDGPKKRYKQ